MFTKLTGAGWIQESKETGPQPDPYLPIPLNFWNVVFALVVHFHQYYICLLQYTSTTFVFFLYLVLLFIYLIFLLLQRMSSTNRPSSSPFHPLPSIAIHCMRKRGPGSTVFFSTIFITLNHKSFSLNSSAPTKKIKPIVFSKPNF